MNHTSNLNIALQRAINARNCNEVKVLISSGANVNHTVNQNLDTMLHKAKSAGIARDLLGYSAFVNAKNLYNQTPLHSAVIESKAELVKTLLEHEANVNAVDSHELTPLHYAVKGNNVEVIKHLMMNNANFNFQYMCLSEPSPLSIAMMQDDLTNVKALIKYALLRKAEKCVTAEILKRVVDIQFYSRVTKIYLIRAHRDECILEILRMRNEKMSDAISLLQLIRSRFVPLESLCKDAKSMELFSKRLLGVLSGNKYPLYHDIIIERLRSKLHVSCLRHMFGIVKISSVSDSTEKKHTILNQDINSVLAKYLSKNDLFNLILASFEPGKYEMKSPEPKLKRTLVDTSGPSPDYSHLFSKRPKLTWKV